MPRKRKTIPVDCVKRIANDMLANSNPYLVESREAIAVFLERILFDTNNYHGYGFRDGELGAKDESRRYYY
jgi:hypothetical protein